MEPFLKLKNIKKTYGFGAHETAALKGISLDVYAGEILGLLGVNGAGKTTLSSIIATLHPATEGELIFKGKPVIENIYEYRRALGFCPQYQNLFSAVTMEENLFFAGSFYGMSSEKIKERIAELSSALGLSPYLNKKEHMLSGGYKQRFMIARSLMHEPKILLLDEPTVGLDPHIRRQLWKIIKGLKQDGITVILTTHYLDEAEYLSDRVCILDAGNIKLIDTPDKLVADFKQKNLEDVFVRLIEENGEQQ